MSELKKTENTNSQRQKILIFFGTAFGSACINIDIMLE